MIGIILFWISYIVAGILLYTIVFHTYEKTKSAKYGFTDYTITDDDVRHKYPLWLILISIIVFFVPVLNLFLFIMFMALYPESHNVYFNSFLNKKY